MKGALSIKVLFGCNMAKGLTSTFETKMYSYTYLVNLFEIHTFQ